MNRRKIFGLLFGAVAVAALPKAKASPWNMHTGPLPDVLKAPPMLYGRPQMAVYTPNLKEPAFPTSIGRKIAVYDSSTKTFCWETREFEDLKIGDQFRYTDGIGENPYNPHIHEVISNAEACTDLDGVHRGNYIITAKTREWKEFCEYNRIPPLTLFS